MTYDAQVRYARQVSLPQIGQKGQKKLIQSSVLIIGIGGLGAPLALYLAGAGIGRIGLVDADRVALSNLPRQILYEPVDAGRLKTEAASDALLDRNPEVKLDLYALRLEEKNAVALIENYDIVADGSDNFATRLVVNAACHRLKKTLISAAVQGFSGQLATFRPHEGGPCYQCFLGDAAPEDTSCADAGVLGPVAGMMACWQAAEVMKELLGIGESLAGRVIHFDALTACVKESRLSRDPACRICGKEERHRNDGA